MLNTIMLVYHIGKIGSFYHNQTISKTVLIASKWVNMDLVDNISLLKYNGRKKILAPMCLC